MKFITIIILAAFVYEAKSQICIPENDWTYMNETTRYQQADIVALVKVLSITNRTTESYGETYNVNVDLICAVKSHRGVILPLTFTISQMGARPSGCPSRAVNVGFNYIIFLTGQSNPFAIQEVNLQQAVWEESDDTFKLFPDVLNHCYTSTGCSSRPDGWHPMEISSRAEAAEIIVKVNITDIKYTDDPSVSQIYSAKCNLTCNMKQPNDISPIPKQFTVTSLGVYAGQCYEHHVSKGHEFIMFLQRNYVLAPLPGATVPPDMLDEYYLGPQEVNQQQAVFNVTDDIMNEFQDYTKNCPKQPETCAPGVGWQPMSEIDRYKLADNVALVKVLSITDRTTASYGETYNVKVDLICAVKSHRGVILPLTFTISQMGARPSGCPSRAVNVGRNYIVFLTGQSDSFSLHEINQQQAVWEESNESFKLFPDILNHCYMSTGCSSRADGWLPMEISTRADAAEIIVQVKITDIEYTDSQIYSATCSLICNMKQPNNISPIPKQFTVTSLGVYAGQCYEHHVSKGHEFIMFLQRNYVLAPLPGATVPPDMLDEYYLGPQEVNQQQAVFNVTDDVMNEFKDYTDDCPNGSTRPVGSAIMFVLQLFILATFFNRFYLDY